MSRGGSLTVGRHPLARRRAELAAGGIVSAAELMEREHGRRVRVGGAVIVRQRPATAKGLCFATLEDETSFANVAFMPDFYRTHRAVIAGHALLEVEGIVQSRDGAVTVCAERVRPLFTPTPVPPSRDFR